MKTVGVIANCEKERAGVVLSRLCRIAARLGLDLRLDKPGAALVGGGSEGRGLERMLAEAEGVIALGGDGTVLRVVRELAGRDVPVMGVNIGGLGFLTSVAEADLEQAVECLANDDFLVRERTLVEGAVWREGRRAASYPALNEVLVSSRPAARVMTLDVSIDEDPVTTYLCDGLLIATPTGSTGHSMSAGGPILCPDTGALAVCVICPHTLSYRALVVPDSSVVRVTVAHAERGPVLSADGQVGCTLAPGDVVQATRAAARARFIHLPGYSYFGLLRQKLHWRGSNVQPAR